MKQKIRMLTAIVMMLCLLLVGCGGEAGSPVMPTVPDEPTYPPEDLGELVILFSGGLEEVYARDTEMGAIGYGALVALRDRLEEDGSQVVMVDGGDSLASENDHGDTNELWDLVDAMGYDVRVPGDLERSMGMEAILDRAEDLKDCAWIGCGISGAEVITPYALVEAGSVMVGFVGVAAPEGDWDAQTFYDTVQQAIDDAANGGADYVICVGNLGTDPGDSPFTAPEVMAHITGYSAFLDCGGDSLIEGTMIRDKDDFEVPLCAVGRDFLHIGLVRLDLNEGQLTVELLSGLDEEDKAIRTMAEEITADREAAATLTTEPTDPEAAEGTDPEV